MNTNARFIRRYRELSQRQVAALAGIDRSAVSRIERGVWQPTETARQKLADALDLDPDELLERPR